MLYSILIATDSFDHSNKTIRRAAMLYSQLKCGALELIAVQSRIREVIRFLRARWPFGRRCLDEPAAHQLKLMSEELGHLYGARCSYSIRTGEAAEEIKARAEQLPAGLTVIGDHPRKSFLNKFRANIAGKLVARSRCPILVVRSEPEHGYRHVLVPNDFSESSLHAVRFAAMIAPGAHFVFLHAFQVPYEEYLRETGVSQNVIDDFRERAAAKAHRELDWFLADVGLQSKLVSRIVKPGFPESVIRRYVIDKNPDLIVIGRRGKPVISERLLGNVTQDILNRTRCDLLVVVKAADDRPAMRAAA